MQTYTKGQVVKYSKPQNEDEKALRFIVIEDRETRLLVGQVVEPKRYPLGLTECYAKGHYELAND